MTLIVETGVGVRGANAYTSPAYVTSYLTARGRQTENSWSTAIAASQEAAIIAATDYVDKRFGPRFLGVPAVIFEQKSAVAEVTFTGLPTAGDTITVGDETYDFVSSLTGDANEILIGSTADECASRLADALNGAAGAGVTYGVGTPRSRHVSAASAGGVLTLTALAAGAQGSLTELSEALDNVTITSPFAGGVDGGLQSLSWPRSYAYDERGQLIVGIPDRLRQAVSEYAVRAISTALLPDPTTDPYAGSLNRRKEKVGPIEEEVEYDSGTIGTRIYTPYPAADKILRPLLLGSGGGVIRA